MSESIDGKSPEEWARIAGIDPVLSKKGKAMPSGGRVNIPVGGVHPTVIDFNEKDSFNLRRWGVDWDGPEFKLPQGWAKRLTARQSIEDLRSITTFGPIARVVSHRDTDGTWVVGATGLDPNEIEDHLEDLGYSYLPLPKSLMFFGDRGTRGRYRVTLHVRNGASAHI
jgi:hypothetical protein